MQGCVESGGAGARCCNLWIYRRSSCSRNENGRACTCGAVVWTKGQRHEPGGCSPVCCGNVTPETASVSSSHAAPSPQPHTTTMSFTHAHSPFPPLYHPASTLQALGGRAHFFLRLQPSSKANKASHHHAASTKTSRLRLPPPSLPVLGAAAPTAKPRRCPLLHRGAAGTCTWGLGCGMLSD